MTTNLIAITYTVIANPRGGWLPVYSVNGHRHGNEWAVHGYDKDEALARAEAEETASRFIGDWVVRVEEDSSK